jgi:hypothetical protein
VRRAVFLLIAWLAAVPACIPSTPALVAARRYDDALCHARSEAEAKTVALAIERDADPRVHVYAVHRAELLPVLGDKTDEIADKVTFVRARVGINEVPSHPSAHVTLSVDDKTIAGSATSIPGDATVALLFGLTGESVPGSRTVVDQQKLAKEVGWAVFTLGLKPLLFGTEKVTYEAPPGHDDYVRRAPRAMSVYDGLRAGGVEAFLVPRAAEQRAKLTVSLQVATSDEDHASCTLSIAYTAPLGQPSRPLPDVVDERFQGGIRRPSDLTATVRYAVSNPYGAWAW